MVLVSLIYRIVCANLFQSSVLGSRTLLVRYAIHVSMSGLVLFLKYNNLAVSEWNLSRSLSFSKGLLRSILNRLSSAGVLYAIV